MLIENAYYILTPAQEVPEEKISEFQNFIESLKRCRLCWTIISMIRSQPLSATFPTLSPPLVCLVKDADTPDELMKQLAAGGFKDITRIASPRLPCGSISV